jgi:hypothetical protein
VELWIWLVAIATGSLVLIVVLAWVGSRGVVLARKLKPFGEQVTKFQKSSRQYPEAVKFYSELAKSLEKPDKKP